MGFILEFLVISFLLMLFTSRNSERSTQLPPIEEALERIRHSWDLDELNHTLYNEIQRVPQFYTKIYSTYQEQLKLLNGLAMEEIWAYNEIRRRIKEKLARSKSNEWKYFVRKLYAKLLYQHPILDSAFDPIRDQEIPKQAPTPKSLFGMCHSIPEIKKRFRHLAFLNHPDKGGNPAAMKEILRQYEEALDRTSQY